MPLLSEVVVESWTLQTIPLLGRDKFISQLMCCPNISKKRENEFIVDVVSDQKSWYVATVVTLITFFLRIPHYGP